MRLLVITRAPWLNDNGIGSTLTDFFSEFKNTSIYGLCLREAPYVTDLCEKNYYISETQLINNIIKSKPVGKITPNATETNNAVVSEKNMYDKAKKYNLYSLHFVRELIWILGKWNNKSLEDYLCEANPDVIFFPDFPCVYAHKVLKFVKEKTNAKVAIFHADDCYSLRQVSFSPMFWLYRFYLRKWVMSSVKSSDLHYVISDVQKEDYDKSFNVNNNILTKFDDFSADVKVKKYYNTPLQLVFTGNIGVNRWKSLKLLADTLKSINANGTVAELRIYTGNNISPKIEKSLQIEGTSYLMGKAPASEMKNIQSNADILVHVEATDIKNRLLVRQSFSTKIVDYLKRGRAILAVGPKDVASIKHLIDNDCALVASNSDELKSIFKSIAVNKELLNDYAVKAYNCGKKHHNREDMLKMLYNDLTSLI